MDIKLLEKSKSIARELSKKHGLQLMDVEFHERVKGRYKLYQMKGRGQSYLLKVVISEKLYDEKSFWVEEVVSRVGAKTALGDFIPEVIESQTTTRPYWYLRKFSSGNMTSSGELDIIFDKNFLKNIRPSQMLEFFEAFWSLRENTSLRQAVPVTRGSDEILALRAKVDRFVVLDDQLKLKIQNFLTDQYIPMDLSLFMLNHNDLNPTNLLYTKSDFQVIDWERAGFDFPLSDVALVWLSALEDENWQEEFREQAVELFQSFGKVWVGSRMEDIVDVYWRYAIVKWGIKMLEQEEFIREDTRNGSDRSELKRLRNYINSVFTDCFI